MQLSHKKILLGITGGIAAYKSCELLRLLQKEGAEVRVAMTPAATTFVGPLTFAALSGYPVFLQSGDPNAKPFQHIDYPRWADLLLVVPCSANTLARMASGFADEPVSLCFMAGTFPKWIAPAMNSVMYLSAAVQANMEVLRHRGVTILEAPSGVLACGEVGPGRCPEPESIVRALLDAEEPTRQGAVPNGRTVLITAGRTEEAIDPVRYISNRSSGKTAVALAQAFVQAGYAVKVIRGPMEASLSSSVESVTVKSACEMHKAVMDRLSEVDAVIHCAAVADYRPKTPASEKIKDSRNLLSLELQPNPSILRDTVAAKKEGQVIVGFALETDHAAEHAVEKLKKSGADLLVLNTPVAQDSGFGFDSVAYALVEPSCPVPPMKRNAKTALAEEVVTFVSGRLGLFPVADWKALHGYLEGQAELGTEDVFLDEPWAFSSSGARMPRTPVLAAPLPSASVSPPTTKNRDKGPLWTPPPTTGTQPYEKAATLASFYEALKAESLYVKNSDRFRLGSGPEKPAVMLVFYAPMEDGGLWNTDVGTMLGRLLESLHVSPSTCFVSYFHKTPVSRKVSPLVAGRLRKMLSREVALVQPGMILFFGEPLLRQALEIQEPIREAGGTPVQFAGIRATALLDPWEMLQDKQLKVITWKTHIPRCGFFI